MTGSYDPRTALVVVDVQNDFADPAGSLFVAGGEEVVRAANTEIEAARSGGATVVYTQDWHPPTTPHFDTDGGTWPVHCVRDTWGAELHPGLIADGPIVPKGTGGEDGYSGFSMQDPDSGEVSPTGLHELLGQHDIERLVVVGLALDVCVKATALDAVGLGYDTTVVLAASAPVELQAGDGERAVTEMRDTGVAVR